jgi:Uma2 family endonuclease
MPTAVLETLLHEIETAPMLKERLSAALLPPPVPAPGLCMSYQEFLDWADEDTLAEWVDGEIVMSSPASLVHQTISYFLSSVLGLYIDTRGLGMIRSAPFQMKIKNGREPDLLFVRRDHLQRLKATYLDGPADLVIEIISPESVGRDRGEKFYEYESGGVAEYWLIDPLRQWAEFYQLTEQQRYDTVFAGRTGVYRSAMLPGFWLRVEWLWQEPLPQPLQALGEIADIPAEVMKTFLQALQG